MSSPRTGAAWLIAATLALPVTVAAASAAGPASADRIAAQALVDELGRDASHRALVADSIGRVADALERATRMRVAGDDAHAAEAEALARQWAETGRALLNAVVLETRVNELQRKALEAEAQVAKTRELVEEVIARTGRLRAQIEAADRERGAGHTAVELHEGEAASGKGRSPAKNLMGPSVDGGAP